MSVNSLAARVLRVVDRRLFAAMIPVDHFGWRKLGSYQPDIGSPGELGRWEFSEEERERFFRHNRWLMHAAARCRALAVRIERGAA